MELEKENAWARELLRPGETLLWSGKPQMKRVVEPADLISLALMGVVAFFGGRMLRDFLRAEQKNVIGIVVICAALVYGFGRILWTVVQRFLELRSAAYALTDQRVIGRNGKKTKSLELTSLPRMTVAQRGDGSGDILFGANPQAAYAPDGFRLNGGFRYRGGPRPGFRAILEFREIPELSRVERMICEAVDLAQTAAGTDGE